MSGDDVVEDSDGERERLAEAWYDELRQKVQHATRAKQLSAGHPFVDRETGDLYVAWKKWPGDPIVDHAAIKQCILMRLQEALKSADPQAAEKRKLVDKRAKALAAQVVRGEGQVDEPETVTDVSSLVHLKLVWLPMLEQKTHAGYEPPRRALRRLPPHLRFLSLSKAKYDEVMDILCSDGTAMPRVPRFEEDKDVKSIEPQNVVHIFQVLAMGLPTFFYGDNNKPMRLQVSCAGHTFVFSRDLQQQLRALSSYRLEVCGCPRARIDVLVWLGCSGDDWYEFCATYWPFLQRGVLLVYPANVDAPGVKVYSEDAFQMSVIGGYRLKRCTDMDIINKFIEMRKKGPIKQSNQIRKEVVVQAMRACGVSECDWARVKKMLQRYFKSEPCGQKRKRA